MRRVMLNQKLRPKETKTEGLPPEVKGTDVTNLETWNTGLRVHP